MAECRLCVIAGTPVEIGARVDLAGAQDMAIREVLALQDRVGFKFATDGEFRRRSYHSYFYSQLCDINIDAVGQDANASGGRATQPVSVTVAQADQRPGL